MLRRESLEWTMVEIDKLPEELRERAKEDILDFGEWSTSHSSYMVRFGGMLQELKPSDTDFVWFVTTLRLITLFGSQDPSPAHFTAAREYLKSVDIDNDKAVDLLARALVVECQKFKEYIFEKFSVCNITIQKTAAEALLESRELSSNEIGTQKHQKHQEQPIFLNNPLRENEGFFLTPERTAKADFVCSQDGCNAIDLSFSEFLQRVGKCGQDQAKRIQESAHIRYQKYQEKGCGEFNRQEAWSVWIPKERSSLFSPFLRVLVDAVWNDKCKDRWGKEGRNVPALTRGVLVSTIKPPLSKGSSIEVLNNSITCYSTDGKEIATVPCVDPRLVSLIRRGMEGFPSLTGHKLLRWQVRTGFNNWANEIDDIRLICTTGGYEGIARQIGCGNSKQSPTDVKAILYAQAHGIFQFPNGDSGNMIILRELDKLRNGEPSKINIVLGELLLPNFGHSLAKGETRRLVPITDFPPLIGSKNTHAAQAMLQLLILELFSDHSDVLAVKNSIPICANKWNELANKAGLPEKSLLRVIPGWLEGDLFAQPFLERQGDEYTLGPSYTKELKFLEYQGQQRIEGAKGGIKSAAAKKASTERKYSRSKKPKG